jgi:hypothetical protein
VAIPLVDAVGFGLDHRPYDAATALTLTKGTDLGMEFTLFKLPTKVLEALTTAGYQEPIVNVLPIPRFHLAQGLGKYLTLTASYIGYKNYKIFGGGLKYTFLQPTEGPHMAFRVSYNSGSLDLIKTKTISTQLLISKRFDFMDPYFGIGSQYTMGTITLPLSYSNVTAKLNAQVWRWSADAFIGIRAQLSALLIVLETSYNLRGTHAVGAKVGFNW